MANFTSSAYACELAGEVQNSLQELVSVFESGDLAERCENKRLPTFDDRVRELVGGGSAIAAPRIVRDSAADGPMIEDLQQDQEHAQNYYSESSLVEGAFSSSSAHHQVVMPRGGAHIVGEAPAGLVLPTTFGNPSGPPSSRTSTTVASFADLDADHSGSRDCPYTSLFRALMAVDRATEQDLLTPALAAESDDSTSNVRGGGGRGYYST